MTVLFIFVPVLVMILLVLNVLLAVHRPDTEKVTPYECGLNYRLSPVRIIKNVNQFNCMKVLKNNMHPLLTRTIYSGSTTKTWLDRH
jgi:NADH:ubiquinone oxidoreductase subunit 3 (subunit A)